MKKVSMILAVFALLTFGIVSCEPEVNGPDSPTNPTPSDTTSTSVSCGETRGEWVDLGLPSGLLWYSVNIGASSPEQSGCYFAWGETQAKEEYNWSTYSYCTADAGGRLLTLTKYNTSETYGTVDNLMTLEASDDVATVVLGAGARIPTYDDWVELRDNTTGKWRTQNGIEGWKFTTTDGTSSIFLPAAGYWNCGPGYTGGRALGCYLSSSLEENDPSWVMVCWFESPSLHVGSADRSLGRSVRAVRASQN